MMHPREKISEFQRNLHATRVADFKASLYNDRKLAVVKAFPSNWRIVYNESSVLLYPKDQILPCIKIFYDGRLHHDWGTRKKPQSEVLQYKSNSELVKIVKTLIQSHSNGQANKVRSDVHATSS